MMSYTGLDAIKHDCPYTVRHTRTSYTKTCTYTDKQSYYATTILARVMDIEVCYTILVFIAYMHVSLQQMPLRVVNGLLIPVIMYILVLL